MAVILSGEQDQFPPSDLADDTGLLAIGGNVNVRTVLSAYRRGIFPWYNSPEPVCWYSPDPRFVLFPQKIHISSTMKQIMRNNVFDFRINKEFPSVIERCKSIPREGQAGTWISQDVVDAYTNLFELGYATSAESWQKGKLVGGLYGVRMGKVFFGESMFSEVSNASKFAFINFISYLTKEGIELVDCQVYTPHLASLGASFISRREFEKLLKKLIAK